MLRLVQALVIVWQALSLIGLFQTMTGLDDALVHAKAKVVPRNAAKTTLAERLTLLAKKITDTLIRVPTEQQA